MGFLTHVDDIQRKKKLMDDFIFGSLNILTIAMSGKDTDLDKLYRDREIMEASECADEFSIIENVTTDLDGNSYNASLTFVKK